MATWKWSKRREEAAVLVARDDLTNEEIAAQVGITRQALDKWKLAPEFDARVQEHLTTWRRTLARKMRIADREARVAALQDRWERMQQVIAERGDAMAEDAPGGGTGLLVHDVKSIGGGEFAQRVDLYRVDTGILAELRATERQAAEELGQWTERKDVTTKGQAIGVGLFAELSDEEIDRRLQELEGRAAPASVSPEPE